MKIDLELNDSVMSTEQIETFSFNVYKDINEYLEQNPTQFDKWLLWDIVEKAIKGENVIFQGNYENEKREDIKYECCNICKI